MSLTNHKDFLKQVFFHSITAFGGPQGHIGMILKRFVEKKKFITEEELFEYNNFCQLLPGPSSTQLITLIAYKKGGISLAIFTLLIWLLPACFIMGLFSFIISYLNNINQSLSLFRFIQPMAIGFLFYATSRSYKNYINNTITKFVMIFSGVLIFVFIKQPWIIPILFFTGGLVTNISNKRFPALEKQDSINFSWKYLIMFFAIFITLGFLSETARKNQWNEKNLINLSEHTYRFGSIVFGGGDVLLPMMIDQYVERPNSSRIKKRNPEIITLNKNDLLSGYGLVKAIPGPVFSISAYVGGISLKNKGMQQQILGIIISSIFIFLPGMLLLFFFFPIWESLKTNVYLYRSMEGIGSVTVGLLLGTSVFLMKDYFLELNHSDGFVSLFIILFVFLMNSLSKIPPPILVIVCFLFGLIF